MGNSTIYRMLKEATKKKGIKITAFLIFEKILLCSGGSKEERGIVKEMWKGKNEIRKRDNEEG